MKQPHAAALSLEKFAAAKKSSHNKREILKKQHLKKLNKVGKYKRLLHRLEGGQGKPGAPSTVQVRDRVAELEDQFFVGDADQQQATTASHAAPPGKKRRRAEHGAQQDAEVQADELMEGSAPHHSDHGEPQAQPAAKRQREQSQQQQQQQPQQPQQPQQQKRHQDLQQASIKPRKPGVHASLEQQQHSSGKKPVQASLAPSAKHQKPVTAQQEEEAGDEGVPANGSKNAAKQQQGRRPPSRMQRLLDEQHAQRDASAKQKQQAMQIQAQRQAEVQQAQKHRRVEKQRYFKRTRTGQPLMRFRMEKILNALQHEAK